MKVAVFSSKSYDQEFLSKSNESHRHEFTFLETRLNRQTVPLAQGHKAVCCFVNDELNAEVLQKLSDYGCEMIALRCAGFNNLDLVRLKELGLTAARVPAYSPYSVAEHALGLILTLNRCIHRAYNRVRELNFSLVGLTGFDLQGATVGVVGTGKIGQVMVRNLSGLGCHVLAYDPHPSPNCQATYVELPELLAKSRVVSLHCPLTPQTHHLINDQALRRMRPDALLINTSRGGLVDTVAVVEALKQERLGGLAIDVYEEEEELFFEDQSGHVLQDDVFARLLTFPNVLVTGHQAFLTQEALSNIADITMENLTAFERGEPSGREL